MKAFWLCPVCRCVEPKPGRSRKCASCHAKLERLGGANKYSAKKTEVDGIKFDSRKEAKRYQELKLMEGAGIIGLLTLQPPFPLVVNGVRVGLYFGDFRYVNPDGKVVIEDAKGVRTPLYRLKKKLVEVIYNITITEV